MRAHWQNKSVEKFHLLLLGFYIPHNWLPRPVLQAFYLAEDVHRSTAYQSAHRQGYAKSRLYVVMRSCIAIGCSITCGYRMTASSTYGSLIRISIETYHKRRQQDPQFRQLPQRGFILPLRDNRPKGFRGYLANAFTILPFFTVPTSLIR